MLINTQDKETTKHVKFISYTGRYPNLCRGLLTLEIDCIEYTFGHDYSNNQTGDYSSFWYTGGRCGFTNNYQNSYVNHGEWVIDCDDLPNEFKKYAAEIDKVFNENVDYGCCGGCL